MKEITLKIEIAEDLTFEHVMNCKNTGGKFVVYQYLFPRPLFPPVKRISRIYYLNANESSNKYALKYNLITLIWGWWGLPFGPTYTYSVIKNNKLGTDFTEDVLENLTEDDFSKNRVTIKKISAIYIHPDKSTIKEFVKCFQSFNSKENKLQSNPFIGMYIDTEKPYYVIGLSEKDYILKEDIKKALYKYFYNHTQFEFIRIDESNEMSDKLLTQGLEINCC